MLKGKHILIGVTGSIAAFKAAIIVRSLVKEGAEVKVLMTSLARQFITPLTMATLSKNPILVEFFDPENGNWNSHVDLGLWADIYLIAPATANTIGKMAHGIADNLLLTTYLSARCPVIIAPAMDVDMFNHKTTRQNLQILKSNGNIIIEPAIGELASGLEGKGRMEEPEKIIKEIKNFFAAGKLLNGKRVLVTAGPTMEAIDPVRFIGNHSSGKMGYALADVLTDMGADVVLVSGPVKIAVRNVEIKVIQVTSAKEMHKACLKEFPKCDAAIMAAAVADFAPSVPLKEKLKKSGSKIKIELSPNPDIAFDLGKIKKKGQILAGFALETNNALKNAKEKLFKKNLDFIVINSLEDKGAGFNTDTNKIAILDKNNKILHFELKEKDKVARDIADKLCTYFSEKKADTKSSKVDKL